MNNEPKKKYWFKRRRFGWGWIPVTWQGLTVLIVGLVIILVAAFQLPPKPAQPTTAQLLTFLAIVFVVVVALVLIGYAKSPKPHWRWGKRPDDNPDEDF